MLLKSGFFRTALCTVLVFLAVSTTVAAEPAQGHGNFKELMFAGCLPSVVTGTPVEMYAQKTGLPDAQSELANAFLKGRPGKVYLKADRETPMVLVGRSDGSCTVAARTAPDPEGLVRTVEEMLLGTGSPFKRIETKDNRTQDGSLSRTHRYKGMINKQNILVILTTTNSNGTLSQAAATIARVAA